MNIEWKITELTADKETIKSAKYYVSASYEGNKVETEGYCYFNGNSGIPIASITEEIIIGWVKEITTQNGVCLVTQRLKDQLAYLESQAAIELPWKPKTFKLNI